MLNNGPICKAFLTDRFVCLQMVVRDKGVYNDVRYMGSVRESAISEHYMLICIN